MRRLRGATYAVVLALSLVASGCSGSDPAAAPVAPSASADEPTESPAPTEPPPPEPVDPCTLLSAEDIEDAGVQADVAASVRSLVPDPNTTTCLVPHPKEGWGIYYGFSTKPGVKVGAAVAQVGTEKPVKLSLSDEDDEARLTLYSAYGDKIWHAWASHGQYTVMLELFEKPRPAEVEALLSTMLEGTDLAMFDFPIDQPAACPSPKSKPITALLGKVGTATGSEQPDDLRCDYANARGVTLNLQQTPFDTLKKVRSTVGSVAAYFDEREQLAPGVTLFLSPGEAYAFTTAYLEKPPSARSTNLGSSTVIGSYYRPLEYDAGRYRAVARWWARSGRRR